MKYRGIDLEDMGLPRKVYVKIRKQAEALDRSLESEEIDGLIEKNRKYILPEKKYEKSRVLRWLFKKYEKKPKKEKKKQGYPGMTITEYAIKNGYNPNGFASCVRRFCIGGITKEWFDRAEKFYIKNLWTRQLRHRIREILPDKKDENLAFQRITLRGWTFEEAVSKKRKKWQRRN